MNKDEFIEFCENDYELLEDDEWDNYSLLNGKLLSKYDLFDDMRFLIFIFFLCLDKVDKLPIDWKNFLNE